MAKQKAETLKKIFRWLLPLTLVVSACSGSPSTSTDRVKNSAVPLVTEVPVESGLEVSQIVTLDYEPDLDGFGFENYGGGQAPASMTVNLARRLYGDEQACVSVTDGECTPQPVILQLIEQANRAMAGGLCEGFAVLSLRLYQEGGTTQLLGQEAIVAALERGDPRVAAELAFWFVTQFSSETQAAAAFYREQTPSEIVAALADDFANPGTTAGYTLGLYSAEGGHAVTPYAVESIDGGSRIYIYDSNWPTETRWIDVIDNTWTYALAATNPTEAAAAWTGTTGTLELTPMASRQPPFSCAFCPQPDGGKSMTLITAAGSSESQIAIQVVDEEGNRLGVFDGELVNEIPGAVYRYIATSNTSDPVFILLPAAVENYTADVESVDGTDDGAVSLFVAQDGAGARVETTMADISDAEDEQPVLAVSEDTGYEINDLDEAQVDIADENVSVSIQIEDDQELAFQFVAPEPPQTPVEPGSEQPTEDTPAPVEPVTAPQIMLSISSDAGEVLAEVEIVQEEEQEAPEEFVIELNDEGEIEIEIEEIEARPATIFAEMRELVVERIEAEEDEDYEDPWHIEIEIEEPEQRDERDRPELEEPEPVNFLLDLDSDFWDEDNWDEDWEDEEQEWAWVAGEEFVEWIEEAPEEFAFAETLSDEFFEQMDEIVLFTEELEELLPERIEGEWTDEGFAVPLPVAVIAVIPEEDFDEEDFDEEPEEFMIMLPPDFDEEIPPDFFTDMPMPWDLDENDFEEIEPFEDDFDDWMPDNSIPEWQMIPDEESGEWQDIEDDWEEIPEELEDFRGEEDEEDDEPDSEQADDPNPFESGREEEEEESGGEEESSDELRAADGLADDDHQDDTTDSETGAGETEREQEQEEEEIEVEVVPAPQPSYSGGSQSTLEDLGQTSSTETTETTTVAVSSALGFNSSDGYWYQTVTTATTVTETAVVTTASSSRVRVDDWYCYDDGYGNGGCESGVSYSETQIATTIGDPDVTATTTEVITSIPASCSQGGWTGFGDWCIVGGCSVCNSSTAQTPANRNQRDIIQFTVPDDPDVVGETRRIVIEAETNLRRDQFNQNNQHADPYIYLYNDTDADTGDHSGDSDEYTRGTLIELDDDSGRDCSIGGDSWACNNPPADAVDEAEFPNDTIVGYETPRPVIQNVQNQWDAEIDRLMQPGDYAIEATVFNAANAGWYRLTISDETVESSGS